MPKIFFPQLNQLSKMQKKKMFILVDDKDRENEGDLVVPASKCNSKIINFMAKHGRGLICLALTKQTDKLRLPLMSQINRSTQTAFTILLKQKKNINRYFSIRQS